MSSCRPIRCGIIGAGSVAWRYDGGIFDGVRSVTHASCFDRHPDTVLNAVFDPDKAARADFAEHHPRAAEISITGALPDLLSQRLDLVSICSPSAFHVAHIRACLDANIPYLWVEKPVALDIGEYNALLDEWRAGKARTRVSVNYIRRTMQQYRALKEHVRGASAVTSIEVEYSQGLDVNGVHMLDLVGWLLDVNEAPPLDWITGTGGPSPSFGLRLGGTPIIVNGLEVPYHCNDVRVIFADRRLSITGGGVHSWLERRIENAEFPGFFHLGPPEEAEPVEACLQHLRDGMFLNLNNLLDDDATLESSLESAYFAQALLSRVQAGGGR